MSLPLFRSSSDSRRSTNATSGFPMSLTASSAEIVSMWGHPDQEEGPLAFVERRELDEHGLGNGLVAGEGDLGPARGSRAATEYLGAVDGAAERGAEPLRGQVGDVERQHGREATRCR